MKKRYEVTGMMEWHPVFTAGRARIRVSFTGGHLCGGGTSPATFETSDEVVQTVIEHSPAFRSGKIRLAWSKEEAAGKPEAKGEEKAGKDMTFDSLEEAQDYLQFTHGIPTSRILDSGSCAREASRIGITLRIKTGSNGIHT